MIASLVDVELRKLRGSLAPTLLLIAPALPGVLVALSFALAKEPPPWGYLFNRFAMPMWAMFLLPMSVALFTVVLAQIEYRSHAWDHLLALPIVRWQLFVAKAAVALMAVIQMTVLAMLFTGVGGLVGAALTGHYPPGDIAFGGLCYRIVLFLAASTLTVAVQLWVSLRFRNLLVPLTVGLMGTLVALSVAITGIDRATWFPWVLPLKVLSDPHAEPLAISGVISGLAMLALMVIDLSRRSFR